MGGPHSCGLLRHFCQDALLRMGNVLACMHHYMVKFHDERLICRFGITHSRIAITAASEYERKRFASTFKNKIWASHTNMTIKPLEALVAPLG